MQAVNTMAAAMAAKAGNRSMGYRWVGDSLLDFGCKDGGFGGIEVCLVNGGNHAYRRRALALRAGLWRRLALSALL